MSEPSKSQHHFVIEPLARIGPISLGMHKDEVSHAFLYPFLSYFRTAESKVRSDRCEAVGLIIHYDDYRRVKEIEAYQPKAESVVTLELFGHDVTNCSMKQAIEIAMVHSKNLSEESHGFDFPDLGLSLCNSRYTKDSDPVNHFRVGAAFPFDPYRTRM